MVIILFYFQDTLKRELDRGRTDTISGLETDTISGSETDTISGLETSLRAAVSRQPTSRFSLASIAKQEARHKAEIAKLTALVNALQTGAPIRRIACMHRVVALYRRTRCNVVWHAPDTPRCSGVWLA